MPETRKADCFFGSVFEALALFVHIFSSQLNSSLVLWSRLVSLFFQKKEISLLCIHGHVCIRDGLSDKMCHSHWQCATFQPSYVLKWTQFLHLQLLFVDLTWILSRVRPLLFVLCLFFCFFVCLFVCFALSSTHLDPITSPTIVGRWWWWWWLWWSWWW